MPTIRTGEAAMILRARKKLNARVQTLSRVPGFLGAAIFRPVKRYGDRLAYTLWAPDSAVDEAFDSGDAALLRTLLVEVLSVRLKAASDDHDGALALDTPGITVLVATMSVDPARHDELIEILQRSTDTFLPDFAAVRAVAFHHSEDRTLVVEVLHITGALALALTQLKPKLRQHRKNVASIVRSEAADIYRLERVIASPSAARSDVARHDIAPFEMGRTP